LGKTHGHFQIGNEDKPDIIGFDENSVNWVRSTKRRTKVVIIGSYALLAPPRHGTHLVEPALLQEQQGIRATTIQKDLNCQEMESDEKDSIVSRPRCHRVEFRRLRKA
jgi:hypothetical protein